MNVFVANSSLTDLIVCKSQARCEIDQLRSDLAAHSRTRDGLEYFLFKRSVELREMASRSFDTQAIMRFHAQADALIDVMELLFAELKTSETNHQIKF